MYDDAISMVKKTQASVQFRPQNRDLGMVMREVDEDLAIFLGLRNVEMEKNDHLVVESHHFDDELNCMFFFADFSMFLAAIFMINAGCITILVYLVYKFD